MDWIATKRGYVSDKMYLLCGLDDATGEPIIDLGFWHDKWHFSGRRAFAPEFYARVEWPPELVDDGEGL